VTFSTIILKKSGCGWINMYSSLLQVGKTFPRRIIDEIETIIKRNVFLK